MNPWLSLRLLGLERLNGRVGDVDTQVYLSMIFQIAWVEVVKIYFDLTKSQFFMVMVFSYFITLEQKLLVTIHTKYGRITFERNHSVTDYEMSRELYSYSQKSGWINIQMSNFFQVMTFK